MLTSPVSRQQPGLACQECRRRKARCDRVRPSCGICSETGRQCIVVDQRSQRGPRKGQLKDLRSRVASLEKQLIDQTKSPNDNGLITPQESGETTPEQDFIEMDINLDLSPIPVPDDFDFFSAATDATTTSNTFDGPDLSLPTPLVESPADGGPTSSEGELVMSDLMTGELDLLYFERVHPIVPMLHKSQYFFWAGDVNPSPERVCLRSAMRTVAAATSAQSSALADNLYVNTRRMLELQDVHGEIGQPWRTSRCQRQQPAHEIIQAWLLLAHYELMRRPEATALPTMARVCRLLQLSRYASIDAGDAPTVENEWIMTEERRRTLWAAFVLDRLYSTLDERPLMLHEELICARIPMPEADFQDGKQQIRMPFLSDVEASHESCSNLDPFAECVILSNLLRRCVAHKKLAHSIRISGTEVDPSDFWVRHEWLAAASASAMKRRRETLETRLKCDPLVTFNRILAHNTCISLSDTAEANSWVSLDDHLIVAAYKRLAYQAALETARLCKAVPRIAFFKTHPFTPYAVSSTADFLTATTPPLANLVSKRDEGISTMRQVLKYLSDVNVSARELLHKPEPRRSSFNSTDATRSSRNSLDFVWNEPCKAIDVAGFQFLSDAM